MPMENQATADRTVSTSSMVKASGLITMIAVISKLFGFARETVIAAVFGATGVTDSYLVAYMLPSMLFAAVGAAIVTAFIPVFTEVKNNQGQQTAFALVNKFGTAALLVVGVLVLLGEVFAPVIVHLLAPGFSGGTYTLTVSLTRIVTPVMFLLTLSFLATASLNALREFTIPAMVGLPYNIIIITMVLWLGSQLGIYGLAFGTLLAIVSQVLIQLPVLIRSGYRPRLDLDLGNSTLRKIGWLMGPVILSSVAGQVNLMIDRILASGLSEGSIAALNFANRVNALPMGLFVMSIVTVMYPSLSEYSATANEDAFARHLGKSLGIIFFLILPMSIGFIVLREPLIQILFQRGAFNLEASRATSFALLYYAIGLTPMAFSEMLKRGFWAIQDTKSPMYISLFTVGLNVILNLFLVRRLGHGGLALGTSLAATAEVLLLIWYMKRRIRFPGNLLVSMVKIILASSVMAAYCFWVWNQISISWLPVHPGLSDMIGAIGLVGASSAPIYFTVAYLLKTEEVLWSFKLARQVCTLLKKYATRFWP